MFFVQVVPSGGATYLKWREVTGQEVLILCSPTPTPPSTPLTPPSGVRVVVDSSTRTRVVQAPFTIAESPKRQWHGFLDAWKGDYAQKAVRLLERQAVTYHFYRLVSGVPQSPLSITVSAQNPRSSSDVPITRDTLKVRLEYHLARAVAANTIKPAQDAQEIPVLEREALAESDPFPCVLLKESISPSDGVIGQIQSERVEDGITIRTRVFRYNVRFDALVLGLNPEDRTQVAKVIHEGLLIDYPLFELLGLTDTVVSRATNSAAMPDGHFQFGEEITVQARFEVRTEESLFYRVASEVNAVLL